MLALHLLQLCLVYINTLMIQQVLAEPAWAGRLNAQDLRGITPLIYSHVNPYGSFLLDLHSRLPIDPPRLALSPSAPKCCSATITSSGEGYFAAPDTNVGFGPTTLHDVRWGESYCVDGRDAFVWVPFDRDQSRHAPLTHLVDCLHPLIYVLDRSADDLECVYGVSFVMSITTFFGGRFERQDQESMIEQAQGLWSIRA